MVLIVTMVTFQLTSLMNRQTLGAKIQSILSWMMDEFIHWPKPYLLLSTTCDEILSWMIAICMENHLLSDNNYDTVNI